MAKTVVGLFDDPNDAQRAIKTLLDRKHRAETISLITTDPKGDFETRRVDVKDGNKAPEGATAGAATGAVLGGVAALLIGTGTLAFPALGIVAAGPIAAALAGVGVGALGGGLIGGLIGLGIPEHHAHTYAEAIRRGAVLLSVEASEHEAREIDRLLEDHGAVDVTTRQRYLESQGFVGYDPKAKPYSEEEMKRERETLRNFYGATVSGSSKVAATSSAEPSSHPTPPQAPSGDGSLTDDARAVYQAQFADRGIAYEQFEEGYRFGCDLPQDPRYRDDWTSHEDEIRREWEAAKPGSWELYRDAVYSGWSRARAQRGQAGLY